MTLTNLLPLLALEGDWADFRAVIVIVISVVFLIGSIYMLLASNFGARLGYLITILSLAAWMIILSVLWLVGAPGTTTNTGPRGPEPSWIPFTAESEQGKDLRNILAGFPEDWDVIGKTYPGNIESRGELELVRASVTEALARAAERDKLPQTKPANWNFRSSDIEPATPEERLLPAATVRYEHVGTRIYFGAAIPAVTEENCRSVSGGTVTGCVPHPATTVFAFRDKGKVYLQTLVFLVVSLVVFLVHLALIGRYEARKKQDDAALELEPSLT